MLARRVPPVEAEPDSALREEPAVAPAVSPGESPEVAPALDGTARAAFDMPTHSGIGDSVGGQGIVVHEIAFSPGQCAALVDFVGDLANLEAFTAPALAQMKGLLEAGIEDTLAWNAVTGGKYSELAQANESHFAGPGGFLDNGVGALASAIRAAQAAQDEDEGSEAYEQAMKGARMAGYTAEHFMQDAFSAGHHVASTDIAARVDAVLSLTELPGLSKAVAERVWDERSDVISCYGVPVLRLALGRAAFVGLACAGGVVTAKEGVADGVRKTVHEQLAETGVEVRSDAHPEPWTLVGDHDLDPNAPGAAVSVAAIQCALGEMRDCVEHAVPGTDADAEARRVFARHAPSPTTDGEMVVTSLLEAATRDDSALLEALVFGVSVTIVEVMDTLVGKHLVVRLETPPGAGQPQEIPEYGPPECRIPEEAPAEDRRSYMPLPEGLTPSGRLPERRTAT